MINCTVDRLAWKDALRKWTLRKEDEVWTVRYRGEWLASVRWWYLGRLVILSRIKANGLPV